MKNRLRKLLTDVERLGLDTQPIRELISSTEVDLSDYEHKIKNLEREVTNHPPGSQPQQVQILVKHLKPAPKEASFQSKNVSLTADNYVIQNNQTQMDPDLITNLQKLGNLVEHLVQQPPSKQTVVETVVEKTEKEDSSAVLEKLEELSNKVDNISTKAGKGSAEADDPNLPKMREGFVNPLDEAEAEKLKGNVHVVPKKGRSMASSLKKLRDLKKG